MKVHHVNCGSMRPWGAGSLVCHVLLVEADNGLVLVDTGFGTQDCMRPARFGPFRRYFFRPSFDVAESAVRQVEALGFHRTDVRHIITTHFDADHIGGLADFPDATLVIVSDVPVAARAALSRRSAAAAPAGRLSRPKRSSAIRRTSMIWVSCAAASVPSSHILPQGWASPSPRVSPSATKR